MRTVWKKNVLLPKKKLMKNFSREDEESSKLKINDKLLKRTGRRANIVVVSPPPSSSTKSKRLFFAGQLAVLKAEFGKMKIEKLRWEMAFNGSSCCLEWNVQNGENSNFPSKSIKTTTAHSVDSYASSEYIQMSHLNFH